MNSICVAGNITRDAEVRHMPNGDPVASFSVADNQGKDKPAIFWNCQLFGKRAASLAPYLLRGGQVTVTGNVTEREWSTQDGNKRKQMEIRVSDLALQGGRREQAADPAPRAAPAPRPAPAPSGGHGFESMDDDVPFMDALKRRGAHLVL